MEQHVTRNTYEDEVPGQSRQIHYYYYHYHYYNNPLLSLSLVAR